jgi:Ca2+-binding RTX toxin-like protein
VHIDLGAAPGYGTAEAIGLHGVTIHGGDRLHSFENASGSNHDDIVEGSGIANRLFGLDGDDEMMGHGGHDSLRGGNGNDSADGGSGNDTLMGDDGSDVLRGGDNSDTVQGGNHNDTLSGNAGNDSFVGGVNSDTIHGDDGFDTAIWEGSGRVVITETASGRITAHQDGYTDTIWGVEAVVTGGGNDDVRLRGGSDLIDLGDGTDFARGGGGNDSILGGTGNDTAYGDGGNDALSGSNGEDWLAGGDGNDTIDGGNHDDTVRGDDGHDVLSGAGGGDVLYGGAGKDTATGGSGEDRFVFWGNGGFDTLADFALGTDLIDVNALVHDAAWNDGTYANDVQAAAIQGGTSTLLYANTDDGWVAFALLSGVGNSAAVQAAIADNSLFFGEMLNDGGPGGVIF